MKKSGGGISSIKLIDKTGELKNYFQLSVDFNTSDSMGANFINSCLESMSKKIKELSKKLNIEKRVRFKKYSRKIHQELKNSTLFLLNSEKESFGL